MANSGDQGRDTGTLESQSGTDKALKKKRSIFRSLSRSRRSSKSRPASPEFVTNSDAPPAVPNGRVVSSSSMGAEPASGQLQEWNSNYALRDLDSNVSRGQEYQSRNTRNSASTNASQKIQNFSRHPRNRSGTFGSYEDSGASHRDTLLPPPPAPPASQPDEHFSPPRDLHHQKSHGAFQRTSDSKDCVMSVDDPTTRPSPPRPSTAIADYRRGREVPNFSSPRVTKVYNNAPELEKPQRSPNIDQWSYRTSRQDEPRASGVSDWSSCLESGSTKHSSVFTKMSYVSDATTDTQGAEDDKDEMTVDDAIDLYAGGFDDDQATPTEGRGGRRHTQFFSHINSESKTSRLAEAMNDSLGDALAPPKSLNPDHPTSAAIINGDMFKSLFPKPPDLQRPTKSYDQYGFRKHSRDVSLAQYDAWHEEYSQVQSRRNAKWVEMMKGLGLSTRDPEVFPPRSVKMQRYIRKGVPPVWRGNVWFFYAGGPEVLQKNPDVYGDLVLASQKGKLSEGDKESIERDLHRTFPDNIHFKPENAEGGPNRATETPLLSALRRVLSAFAIHHPRIGYCQSLNFLAGFLLLFLTEEKAFWMLHIVTTKMLPGTHETSLEGANVDLWVLMLALKDALPSIWTKVGGETQKTPSRLPPISLCTTSWFMSIFIGTLPTETTLRVWDALFYDGSVTIFRVALAVFRLGEAEIRAVNEQMETFQVVQSLPRKMLDVGSLMSMAYRRNTISTSWVEKKRKERKDWYANERLAERARKESKDAERPAPKLDLLAVPGTSGDDRLGRGRELTRNKSTGFWAKRSQSLKRAKSTKRSATVKYNMV
ncbi:MAG: hypothetical protein MMC23_004528 [Stictis urceolatum]|nr:hypothetical protein [Stictis urceolata]